MATFRKIEQTIPRFKAKKRVAAYARVSMDVGNTMESLSTQISYYNALIQKNAEWEFAGVFSDGGISGTSIKNRTGFLELLEACENGKVDIVLVKSISRFARNTVDLLNTVRHLKAIGVEVRFEREGISTFSGDGELLLTLLASFAQAESESISQNEKWAIRKKFEQGIASPSNRCFGYDWDEKNGCCVINENEAVWVRYIYKRYLDGASLQSIKKEMADKDVRGRRGEPLGRTTIRRILSSEVYVGDLLLQRYYTPQIGKRALNKGEVPQYLVSDAHEALISREDFEKVQKIIKERAIQADNYGYQTHYFTGKVKCGKCGASCIHVKNGEKEEYQNIECIKRKVKQCDLLTIRERELRNILPAALEEIKTNVLNDDSVEFYLKKGGCTTRKRDFPFGRRSCFTGKMICADCGSNLVRSHSRGTVSWICNHRKMGKDKCSVGGIREKELIAATRSILKEERYSIPFYKQIEKVVIGNDCFEFIFKEGERRLWQRKSQ